jgi:hypothetical protein
VKPRVTREHFRAQASRVCAQAASHAARLEGLRKLRPPLGDEDVYARWLKAERDAIEAAEPPREVPHPLFDARIALTIAEGKISGYARRLGARACE